MKKATLLSLIAGLLALAGCGKTNKIDKTEKTEKPKASSTPTSPVTAPPVAITVYYFHNTFRCPGCDSVESVAKAAVLGGKGINSKKKTSIDVKPMFAEAIKQKILAFESVNMDEDAGKKLFEELGKHTKIPVIVERKDGKVVEITPLPDAWSYFDDNEGYVKYVQDALAPVIKRCKDSIK